MKKNQVDIITMGCSKNLVDSELLMKQFEANGYHCVHDSKNPQGEIVVINTCGFIQDAKQESINAILEFAQSPCILVGRCADSILREAGIDCFNVFLYADLEHRVHRIEERDHEQGAKVRKMVDKRDQQRKEYYKVYTGSELGDYHNYDISLDTGVIGYDQCVEIIAGIVRRRVQQ